MDQGQRPRILFVDDEKAVLVSYEIILTREGYSVAAADSSNAAFESLRNKEFELIVCDLSLENGASGFDVIQEALKRTPSVPVILMTGYSDTVVPEHLAHGNVTVVAKPANIMDFLKIVRGLIADRQKTRGSDAAD